MRRIIIAISVLFSFVACDLTKLEPAQTDSFMKFFGANGNTVAADLLQVDDGYLVLGNNTGGDFANVVTVMLKTDHNGNLMWKYQYENFHGRSIATDGTSYFINGYGIDGSNPTTMTLYKTDLQGIPIDSVVLGSSGNDVEGYAITISQDGDVVVNGKYSPTEGVTVTDSAFVYGYTTDLAPSPDWSGFKWTKIDNSSLTPSSKIIEIESSIFTYNLLVTNNNTSYSLKSIFKKQDASGSDPIIGEPFEGFNLSSSHGDFVRKDRSSLSIVHSIQTGGKSKIGFTNSDTTNLLFTEDSFNYYAASIEKVANGYIILGSTNNITDSQPRSRIDDDFIIQRVDLNGNPDPSFIKIFGGTGTEEGKVILRAPDGGYVILGTMTNTNNAKSMVLVKLNSKGELIN